MFSFFAALVASLAIASPGTTLASSFESGLQGFNLAGVGEVDPAVVDDTARTGAHACRFALTGHEDRSELILGGNGGRSTRGQVGFHDGDHYWYGFSVRFGPMVYGRPGAHNVFLQLFSEGHGPTLALQLWDWAGERGLWTLGDAMGGNRYLAPLAPRRWHDVQLELRISDHRTGSYRLFVDGRLVDARRGVSLLHRGDPYAYLKTGLYRNGGQIPGKSVLFLDAVKLGATRASVMPG